MRAFLLIACLAAPHLAGAAEPLQLAASLPPHAWLVEAVGGARVRVATLLGPGDSAATYLPTDAQVSRLLASRALFLSGAPFESGAWFSAVRTVASLDLVDLTNGVERLSDDVHAGSRPGTGHDPHIWLSPRRLVVQARTVAGALERLDPDGRADYRANLQTVESLLVELEGEISIALAPFAGRAFVVFHPSWSYFAADFGMRQIAIEVGGKEPSDHQLTRLGALARAERLDTVFVQPQIRSRAAAAVAVAIGARLDTLDPLARDVPDNLRAVTRRLIASFEQ